MTAGVELIQRRLRPTVVVGGIELIGKPRDVQPVDDVAGCHRDADERRRRNERLPARKRVGDGEHGVGRPRRVQRLLGAQPVHDGRSDEQTGRDQRRVQHADAGRTEALLRVHRALQRLETAVADVDEEIDATEVDQSEVDITSTRHDGQRLIVGHCRYHSLHTNNGIIIIIIAKYCDEYVCVCVCVCVCVRDDISETTRAIFTNFCASVCVLRTTAIFK